MRRVVRKEGFGRRVVRRKGKIRPDVPVFYQFVMVGKVWKRWDGPTPAHMIPNASPFFLMNHSSR
jgi:hypothetical protein